MIILKSSLRFNKNSGICFLFKSYLKTELHSKIKTVNMLLKPVKLLKKEQFMLLYYPLLPGEGVTIYTQVMLH